MSYLDDPRVFFAAERTLLAWQRTSIAVIGMGFVIERFALFQRLTLAAPLPLGHARVSLALALLFLIAGAAIALVSAWQYRRFLRGLGAAEVPPGHLTWPGPAMNGFLAFAAGCMAIWFVTSA
jgi:inner membrane protein YidH